MGMTGTFVSFFQCQNDLTANQSDDDVKFADSGKIIH